MSVPKAGQRYLRYRTQKKKKPQMINDCHDLCLSCLDFGLGPDQHSRSDDAILIHTGNAVMNSPAHYLVNKGLPDQHLSRSKYGTGFPGD